MWWPLTMLQPNSPIQIQQFFLAPLQKMLRAPEMRRLKATHVIFNWEKSSGISIQIEQEKQKRLNLFSPDEKPEYMHTCVHIYTHVQADPLLSEGRRLFLNQRSLKSFKVVTVKSPDFALREYSTVLLKCLTWQRIFVTYCNVFSYLRETFGQWCLWLCCVRFDKSMYCIL